MCQIHFNQVPTNNPDAPQALYESCTQNTIIITNKAREELLIVEYLN